MKTEEIVSPSMKRVEKKKCYTSPKIEAIASVREITKGSTLGTTDAGGNSSNTPSDPDGGAWN